MTKSIKSSYYKNIADRLTDKELFFFKKELENKKNKILLDLKNRDSELNDTRTSELRDEVDHAFFAITNLTNNSILKRQYQTLNLINRGLNKIELGTYGVCNLCEETIAVERLKVAPFAEQCISCKEMLENQR